MRIFPATNQHIGHKCRHYVSAISRSPYRMSCRSCMLSCRKAYSCMHSEVSRKLAKSVHACVCMYNHGRQK